MHVLFQSLCNSTAQSSSDLLLKIAQNILKFDASVLYLFNVMRKFGWNKFQQKFDLMGKMTSHYPFFIYGPKSYSQNPFYSWRVGQEPSIIKVSLNLSHQKAYTPPFKNIVQTIIEIQS